MAKNAPLLEELLKYHKENNLILSMPGNKCGIGFERDELGKAFRNEMGNLDITEVEPLDNLHHPEGVIMEAQDRLRDYYGSKRAFFMVNGSTGGNLASIFSAFNEGDEVLIERNCHKSVYNAIILRKLKVNYIETQIDVKNEIFLSPSADVIRKAFKNNKNIKGVVLTYPNYFGITFDIEEVVMELKKQGIKVIIDGAHGAHFNASEKLPKSLTHIADYIVLSAHKTLPSLTGGSYLLQNCDDPNIDFYLSSFMTTSPSYLTMASLDYGRYYLDKYGEEDYNKLIELAETWRGRINALKKVHIIGRENLKTGYDIDKSRYVMILPKGHSGNKLLNYLRNNKIQAEMSFSIGIVLILSPFNSEKDFINIYKVIEKLNLNEMRSNSSRCNFEYKASIAEKRLEPYEVFNDGKEFIRLENSEGKIAGDFLTPYPPGIPIVCPGEIISQDIISIIERYLEDGYTVMGLKEEKIRVVSKSKNN